MVAFTAIAQLLYPLWLEHTTDTCSKLTFGYK